MWIFVDDSRQARSLSKYDLGTTTKHDLVSYLSRDRISHEPSSGFFFSLDFVASVRETTVRQCDSSSQNSTANCHSDELSSVEQSRLQFKDTNSSSAKNSFKLSTKQLGHFFSYKFDQPPSSV